jgi:hypothetical protein
MTEAMGQGMDMSVDVELHAVEPLQIVRSTDFSVADGRAREARWEFVRSRFGGKTTVKMAGNEQTADMTMDMKGKTTLRIQAEKPAM